MDSASERRNVYVMCLVVLVLALFTLSHSLNQWDIKAVGVSLALIAVAIATAIAANRSTSGGTEVDGELTAPLQSQSAMDETR